MDATVPDVPCAAIVTAEKSNLKKDMIYMKFVDFLKNDKVLFFAGGLLTAAYGKKVLTSDKTRKACVTGLAKCMQLQNEAKESFKNMKEEAEDICYDAKSEANLQDK